MYLRFGWVVGNVGLIKTIGIVLMASSITFITGLSASAIATNIKVGVGGEYYMISRSLGLEPGGAIGIPLYLCRTLSVTFYCYGLAEAILILWPQSRGVLPSYTLPAMAAFFIIMVTLLSGKSAKLVLKSQIPIMIIVGLSILALIVGVLTKDLQAPVINATYISAPNGFWYVFAVFFPAVTGFTAGVGMSGDLKDPQKSIPRGTLGAVVTGALVYMIIPLLLAITAALTIEELADPAAGVTIWTRLAILGPWLVYPAVWGAVLSSAFGSILGGPRILQALSMDGLAPKRLSKLSRSGQPTLATWISGAIALGAVFLGSLNTIAQYVSVLFLTRPKIHVPWYISLIGAVAAIVVMILINPWAFVFAFGFEAIILIYLINRKMEQQWGDAAAGVWMQVSRFSLLRLNKKKIRPRNWRPKIILFVRDIKDRIDLVKFTELLGQNSGILTISKLITPDDTEDMLKRNEISFEMQRALSAEGLQALTEVNIVNDIKKGMYTVAASHGVAGLKTNLVVFGWSRETGGKEQELQIIDELSTAGKNILLVNINEPFSVSPNKRIDIWWGGRDSNGDLMLLLSYLMRLNNKWKKATVNIYSLVDNEEERTILGTQIRHAMKEARIDATMALMLKDGNDFVSTILEQSRDADLVLLGLARGLNNMDTTIANIDAISAGLKVVAFVQNNGMEGVIPTIFKHADR
jgi:amino acid transporter